MTAIRVIYLLITIALFIPFIFVGWAFAGAKHFFTLGTEHFDVLFEKENI